MASIAGGCAALLAFILYNSSLTNGDKFTRKFLQLLAMMALLRAIEIMSATYRTVRIDDFCIPWDANLVGLFGRAGETLGSVIVILFLLRPSSKKALNGGGHDPPSLPVV